MAGRPHKQGLDFFSFDVDFFEDEKIEDLDEIYPDRGPGFFQRLLCFIYRRSNYVEWNESSIRKFRKAYSKYSHEEIDQYLTACFDLKLFNYSLYHKYQVLTSASIQERYLYMTRRREKVIYIKEYLLINLSDFKAVNHSVEVWNRDEELVKKFIKNEPVKAAKRLKKKSDGDAQAETIGTGTNSQKQYTTQDLRNDLRLSYAERPEEFRENYSEDYWNAFTKFNQIIDDRYEPVRTSGNQMDFREYISMMTENQPTPQELNATFNKMISLGIKPHMPIYNRFEDCLRMIKSPTPPKPKPPETPPEITDTTLFYRDEPFEKEVLELWRLNTLAHANKLKLLVEFCTVQFNNGQLDFFREQFHYYAKVKSEPGAFKHSFDNFLGKQSERFENGKWLSENWYDKFKELESSKTKGNGNQNKRRNQPEKYDSP